MNKQRLLDDGDPYSHLGEDLWSSILSLLPVHEAVRTSILSRTWRNAWMQIPHLKICFITMCEQLKWDYNTDSEKWRHVVGKFFTSHTGHIQSCIIDPSGSNTNRRCLDGWISILIEKSISELTFKFNHYLSKHSTFRTYRVPHCLFSCKSLRSLELSGCFLRAKTDLSFGCNKLRVMKLDWNRISLKFLHALLHQCSSLETLEVIKCSLGGFDRKESILSINAPHLKVLHITGFYDLSQNIAWKLVLINAPRLKRLDLAMLNFKESHIIARELEIFSGFMRGFYDGQINLKYEALKMEAILNSIAHVKGIILHLPNSNEGRRESKLSGFDFWEKQEQFNCFNHTLRRVTIEWMSKYEIEFAKYVLAKAKVLKHLTICRMSSQPLEEEVLASLPLVERASGNAKLTIRG
ncbi:F-box/FBD/LRR-repeat-like protein [Cinnamomum micranthum f. kanehirae]|uniref:F-box/FBD/LRR-repeat-like protein n=1 Tax=Cinnamomum micranthum f. kanehirae TaxID=337451 RepID=A0A443N4S4_9MAGN|nr:F-box/FBD/LRR-repeat-like protein [Cinnamomum micranthum f. kanehirae]